MPKKNLHELYPNLSKEWHPTKNGKLTSKDVSPGSNKNIWWICSKNNKHIWQATVYSRSSGRGCPYCSGNRVSDDNCLATKNPKLAKEWHPTKNVGFTPRDVTTGTNKKVWWLCKKNERHEWIAGIASRKRGDGCPYCSGRRVSKDNCLATVNPSLAREWNYTRNGKLTSYDVTSNSKKKVWWKCPKNKKHEWEATVYNRNRNGSGCPYCSGTRVSEDNCLETVNPSLAREWHPTKNGKLTPGDVTANSGKKVWWLCRKNDKHVWQTSVANRNHNQSRCPYCYSQTSIIELHLYSEMEYLFDKVQHRIKLDGIECDIFIPRLMFAVEVDGLYWHRNKYLDDKRKTSRLNKKGIFLLRIREKGLKKISNDDIVFSKSRLDFELIRKIICVILKRIKIAKALETKLKAYLHNGLIVNEKGLVQLLDMLPSPILDKSLFRQKPILLKEWHPTKNGKLTPKDVYPGSGLKVWWLCSKNNKHVWQATVASRSSGRGCPYCSGRRVCNDNSLATNNPKLAKEWHPIKNGTLTPRDVTLGSKIKVWWLCKINNVHEWRAAVGSRNRGRGCPYCRSRKVNINNSLWKVNPRLAKEWHPIRNGKLTPKDLAPNSNKKVWWKCPKNKIHEWEATVLNRNWNGSGCPYCSGRRVSKENCLERINPKLAKEWHPIKNDKLSARDVTANSGKKVWWLCRKNNRHEWKASVANRNWNKSKCPHCLKERYTKC